MRIACVVVAAVAGCAETHVLYPWLHGKHNAFAAGMSALLCAVWGLALVSQGVLGYLPNEDAPRGVDRLSPLWRAGMIAGGAVAVGVTALFIAWVGESDPGP